MIGNCPKCKEAIRLPDAKSDQEVRCPLCSCEYLLGEIFDRLPPMLELVGDTLPMEPVGIQIDEGYSDLEIKHADSKSNGPSNYQRQRRPERSAFKEILKVIGGGVIAIPIGILCVWWFAGRDPFDLSEKVSVYAPWIVPEKLRGGDRVNDSDSELSSSKGQKEPVGDSGVTNKTKPANSDLFIPESNGNESEKKDDVAPSQSTSQEKEADIPGAGQGKVENEELNDVDGANFPSDVSPEDREKVVIWLKSLPLMRIGPVAWGAEPTQDVATEIQNAMEFDLTAWVAKGEQELATELVLLKILESNDANFKMERVLFAISWIGTEKSVPVLIRCLNRGDAKFQNNVIKVLCEIPDERATQQLGSRLEIASNGQFGLASNIIVALRDIGTKEAMKFVTAAAGAVDEGLSTMASEELERTAPRPKRSAEFGGFF